MSALCARSIPKAIFCCHNTANPITGTFIKWILINDPTICQANAISYYHYARAFGAILVSRFEFCFFFSSQSNVLAVAKAINEHVSRSRNYLKRLVVLGAQIAGESTRK